MILDPGLLTRAERHAVAAWLEANGAREHVALVPIAIHGRWVHCGAYWRRDAPPATIRAWARTHKTPDGFLRAEPRRVHIRVPLARFLALPTTLARIDHARREAGHPPLSSLERHLAVRSINAGSTDPAQWVTPCS